MTYSLAELIEKIPPDARETGIFFLDLAADPSKYSSNCVKEFTREKVIGRDDIPRQGKIIVCLDNDHYEMQTEDFKKEYSELNSSYETGLVDIVRKIEVEGEKVHLTVQRYVIQKRKSVDQRTS